MALSQAGQVAKHRTDRKATRQLCKPHNYHFVCSSLRLVVFRRVSVVEETRQFAALQG